MTKRRIPFVSKNRFGEASFRGRAITDNAISKRLAQRIGTRPLKTKYDARLALSAKVNQPVAVVDARMKLLRKKPVKIVDARQRILLKQKLVTSNSSSQDSRAVNRSHTQLTSRKSLETKNSRQDGFRDKIQSHQKDSNLADSQRVASGTKRPILGNQAPMQGKRQGLSSRLQGRLGVVSKRNEASQRSNIAQGLGAAKESGADQNKGGFTDMRQRIQAKQKGDVQRRGSQQNDLCRSQQEEQQHGSQSDYLRRGSLGQDNLQRRNQQDDLRRGNQQKDDLMQGNHSQDDLRHKSQRQDYQLSTLRADQELKQEHLLHRHQRQQIQDSIQQRSVGRKEPEAGRKRSLHSDRVDSNNGRDSISFSSSATSSKTGVVRISGGSIQKVIQGNTTSQQSVYSPNSEKALKRPLADTDQHRSLKYEPSNEPPVKVIHHDLSTNQQERASAEETTEYASPLQGVRVLVSNLMSFVNLEDIMELFGAMGAMKRARLIKVGLAEVVYVEEEAAIRAVRKYHQRELDGKPMQVVIQERSTSQGSNVVRRNSDTSTISASALSGPKPPGSNSTGSGSTTVELDLDVLHRALFKTSVTTPAPRSSKPVSFTVHM